MMLIHKDENGLLVQTLRESAALLEAKNRRLEALCETAQQFIENVSHDFRTPLTVIKEYVSLLADGIVGSVNEKQNKMLRVVDDRADDLNTMVDDLLDVSKLQAGLLNVWRRPCRVSDIVDRVLPALARKAAVRQIMLETDFDVLLPGVFCDEDKVGRVLTNLAVNAVKFCRPEGKVRIWALSRPEAREVVVGVSDEGPGIDPRNLEAIFTRFTQLHSGVRHCEKGFGLGLSIARELVELNLGRISVDSTIDVGTTFQFTIPYHDNEEVLARYFARLQSLDDSIGRCELVTASAPGDADARARRDFDLFLSNNVRRNDLALRTSAGQWLLLFEVSTIELGACLERTRRALAEINRNRPFGELPPLELEPRGEIDLNGSIDEAVERALEFSAVEA